MIKKLRKKFITVTMLSTLAVLIVIIGGLNLANYISMNNRADGLLDLIVDNGGTFPDFFMGKRVVFEEMEKTGGERPEMPDGEKPPELPGKQQEKRFEREEMFTGETPYETRFFTVKYNPFFESQYSAYTGRIASVSDDEAILCGKSVLRKFQRFAKSRGYYSNYRYRINPDEDGGRLVVFIDMSKELKSFKTVRNLSLILSGVGLLAVFVLVWFFSKKVFAPVEESDRKQKQFITDASHELKTPLTIISANVEVIEMESEESKWSKSIKHQVERMSTLVNRMVTLSKLDENRELEFVDFSLSEAVRETADAYVPVAARNGQELTVEIEDEIRINADESLIRQMTGLLLDNATKYCEAPKEEGGRNDKSSNGKIRLTLKQKGKKRILSVYNTVSETEIGSKNQYFERFYRPDESRNSNKGGSGIGLAVVKSIAEAHHGSVEAYSKDGKSIRFDVILYST